MRTEIKGRASGLGLFVWRSGNGAHGDVPRNDSDRFLRLSLVREDDVELAAGIGVQAARDRGGVKVGKFKVELDCRHAEAVAGRAVDGVVATGKPPVGRDRTVEGDAAFDAVLLGSRWPAGLDLFGCGQRPIAVDIGRGIVRVRLRGGYGYRRLVSGLRLGARCQHKARQGGECEIFHGCPRAFEPDYG